MSEIMKLLILIVISIIGVFVALVIVKSSHEGNKNKPEYDERQTIQRLKSQKNGFFATLIWTGILILLSAAGIEIPAEDTVLYGSIIVVGLTAMVITGVWNDGYWGINTDKKKFLTLMGIVSAINIIIPVEAMIKNEFIVDGKVSRIGFSFMLGIMFIVILITTIIKNSIDKASERKDEEDD